MKPLSFRLASLLLLGAGLSAQAQSPYIGESLNYSRLQFGGPARTQGIAGANVALGADFGNLSSNPAGLGLFQKSELNISPGLGLGNADAQVNSPLSGASQNHQKNSFHIASLGLVLANRRTDDDQRPWRGGSFALGFSRVADFNTSFGYEGQVADNESYLQRLVEPGGYTNPSSNGYQNYVRGQYGLTDQGRAQEYYDNDGLAYGTYLTSIFPLANSTNGDSAVIITPGLTRSSRATQSESTVRRGSLSQFDLGYGGSYKDRLYIGGAIGIVSSNLRQVRDFSETASPTDATTSFGTMRLHDEVKTEGTGINARIGVIYRANDVIRLGASIQTPTYMQFTETYSTNMTTQFARPVRVYYQDDTYTEENGGTANYSGEYAYALTTPFRANGGIAVTIGKYGFLSGDVEYVGYGQARLRADPDNASGSEYNFISENQAIQDAYKNVINLRVGGEFRADIFRLRLGYARYGNPYRAGTLDRTQSFYTAGLGIRQQSFFLDVAGVYTTFDQLYSPYTLANGLQPIVTVNNSRYTTTVTAGFTF